MHGSVILEVIFKHATSNYDYINNEFIKVNLENLERHCESQTGIETNTPHQWRSR
jgi:hypothetical protein